MVELVKMQHFAVRFRVGNWVTGVSLGVFMCETDRQVFGQ